MIQVTDKAAEAIRNIMKKEGMEDHGLRVAVVGGGCSGMSYRLAFEKDPAEGDKIFEDKGVRLYVDSKSYLFVNGTILDYSDGLAGTGFTFNNPNAKSSCGCGQSFSS
jgi:iron-sulfur cluster assembly protein